jgi:hypothetical protein
MIDPYPISALVDRYKLNSKQAIYDRIKALNIVPVSRGKISSVQLDKLDKLDNHLNSGGSFASFTEENSIASRPVDKISFPLDELELHQNIETVTDSQFSVQQLSAALSHLVKLIAPDPLAHYDHLEKACDRGWLLTTNECAAILGVKPKGKTFTRGSFVLLSVGKIGNQKAWKITKSSQYNQ